MCWASCRIVDSRTLTCDLFASASNRLVEVKDKCINIFSNDQETNQPNKKKQQQKDHPCFLKEKYFSEIVFLFVCLFSPVVLIVEWVLWSKKNSVATTNVTDLPF